MGTAKLSEMLRESPLFRDLLEEDLDALLTEACPEKAEAGETLFQEGDPADKLYLLAEGLVRIVKKDPNGNEIELAKIPSGQFFGDMALIDGQGRSACAITETECLLYTIDRKSLLARLRQSERMLSAMLQGMSARVRSSNQQVYDSALRLELLDTQAQLDRHLSASQMVARVAHEVNTPIGIANQAASLIAQLVRGKKPSDLAKDEEAEEILTDVLEACDLIAGNLRRAATLVGSFKSFSARQAHDAIETVDLGDLILELVRLFRVKPREARLDIQVQDKLPKGQREWRGYPGYLSQILLNLLSNADRYAYPRGSGMITIAISALEAGAEPGEEADIAAPGPRQFQVVVRDYGEGMSPASMNHLFEAFFTTARDKGGTGLGMSIVKHLISGPLKGHIDVVSHKGEGTTFTLRFPAIIEGEKPE